MCSMFKEQKGSQRGIKLRIKLMCRVECNTDTHIMAGTKTLPLDNHTPTPIFLVTPGGSNGWSVPGRHDTPGATELGPRMMVRATPQHKDARQVLSLICFNTFQIPLAPWEEQGRECLPHPQMGKQRLTNLAQVMREVRARAQVQDH